MDKTQRTINVYNKYSQEYANKFMDLELYSERVKDFFQLLKEKDSILDLGCGPIYFRRETIKIFVEVM